MPAHGITLRRRDLAFHGAEDLTPSDFYRRSDAGHARQSARFVVGTVSPHVSRPAAG